MKRNLHGDPPKSYNLECFLYALILGGVLGLILWMGTAPADAAPATDGVYVSCPKDNVVKVEVRVSKPTTVTIYGIGDKSITARVKGSLFLRTDANLYGVYFKGQAFTPREPFRNPCIQYRR